MKTHMSATNKIVQNKPFLKFIRWINFLGLGIIILFSLPLSIVRTFDFDIDLEHKLTYMNMKLLSFYIFIAFSLWVFILFVILETKNRKNQKKTFDDYISSNWLISCGYLFPLILFITLLI